MLENWLPFDPLGPCLHELPPEQEDDNDREQQVDERERGERYDQAGIGVTASRVRMTP